MPNKNIEVEFRGPLSKNQFESLNNLMKRKGKFITGGDRLSLMYFRNEIPKHSKDIKEEKVDLRLRINKNDDSKNAEVVMKYGSWAGTDSRKELSFRIDLNKFVDWIDFLKCLDWKKCVCYATKMKTFTYKEIEFTLVEIKDFGFTFEAEILAEDKEKNVLDAKKKIKKTCEELALHEYKKWEFERQCDDINNTPKLQYDFEVDSPSIIKERYAEYF